jgi:SOS response regulatory protein OraA/RecX
LGRRLHPIREVSIMPRRKKLADATESPATESSPAAVGTNGKTAGQRGFKYEALREALRELGEGAKNKDLEAYIRSKHGAAAVPANLSVAKSNVLKRLRAGKGKARRAAAPAKAKVAPQTASATTGTFSMDDLRQVKDLATRLGKDRLKEIADLLA